MYRSKWNVIQYLPVKPWLLTVIDYSICNLILQQNTGEWVIPTPTEPLQQERNLERHSTESRWQSLRPDSSHRST